MSSYFNSALIFPNDGAATSETYLYAIALPTGFHIDQDLKPSQNQLLPTTYQQSVIDLHSYQTAYAAERVNEYRNKQVTDEKTALVAALPLHVYESFAYQINASNIVGFIQATRTLDEIQSYRTRGYDKVIQSKIFRYKFNCEFIVNPGFEVSQTRPYVDMSTQAVINVELDYSAIMKLATKVIAPYQSNKTNVTPVVQYGLGGKTIATTRSITHPSPSTIVEEQKSHQINDATMLKNALLYSFFTHSLTHTQSEKKKNQDNDPQETRMTLT